MSQPHDALFKMDFGEPAALRGFLRDVLPPEVVPLLDLSQLTPLPTSQVNDKLAVRIPDLLYQAPWRGGGQAQLAVVMEHQSSPDPRMPLRALPGSDRHPAGVGERHAHHYREQPTALRHRQALPAIDRPVSHWVS